MAQELEPFGLVAGPLGHERRVAADVGQGHPGGTQYWLHEQAFPFVGPHRVHAQAGALTDSPMLSILDSVTSPARP